MPKSKQEIENSDKNSLKNYSLPTLFNLAEVEKKKIEVEFSMEKTSSYGGLLLLKEIENQIGIISRFTDCIQDTRHQSYFQHDIKTLLSQRIMQIAAGYEDANDCVICRFIFMKAYQANSFLPH